MFNTLVSYAQKRLAARRRYLQTVAEIDALTNRDLTELGVFQSDLYAAARQDYRRSI